MLLLKSLAIGAIWTVIYKKCRVIVIMDCESL